MPAQVLEHQAESQLGHASGEVGVLHRELQALKAKVAAREQEMQQQMQASILVLNASPT